MGGVLYWKWVEYMDIKWIEVKIAKTASKYRKDYSSRGSIDTRVNVKGNTILIHYIANYSNPEKLLLEHIMNHPSDVYDRFLEKMSSIMLEYFDEMITILCSELKIIDLKTEYYGDNLNQNTVIILNLDLEALTISGRLNKDISVGNW